jgi:hypothetical protein
MTLLGGAVYAGFFTLAALWLVATNPDTAEERVQSNAKRQDCSNSDSTAAGPVGPALAAPPSRR